MFFLSLNCKHKNTEIVKEIKNVTNVKNDTKMMISNAKKTCLKLGFSEGTEKFADCSLKIIKMKSQ